MINPVEQDSNLSSDRYVWHLHPPFSVPGKFSFDRDHWWDDHPNEVNHFNALFEVLRRHPLIRSIHLEEWPGTAQSRRLSYLLWLYGLSSWYVLSQDEKEYLRQVLYEEHPGRGKKEHRLFDITALSKSRDARPAALVDPKVREMEVGRFAIEHHRAGRLIIAVDTDFSSIDDAVCLFTDCFRSYRQKPKKVQRSRALTWLDIIRDFENSESRRNLKTEIRDKALFRRYRNLFSSIREQLLLPENT